MIKTGNKTSYRNTGILLLLLVFLVFGFCPLRNALFTQGRQVPLTTAPKAPEYVKIIAQDHCSVALAAQPVITSGKLHLPPVGVAWLPETEWAMGHQTLIVSTDSQPQSLTTPVFPGRIYLRNRCLLI
ncbi:MAG: hypothetical protein V4592_11255 [Bacteroidota bacterium]